MALTASLPAPRPLLGIGLILAAACCFATMDTSVRYVGPRVPKLTSINMLGPVLVTALAGWLLHARGDAQSAWERPGAD